VHSKFHCRPHAEGAENAENRREAFLRVLHFSASLRVKYRCGGLTAQ
jgi:hypothetical protein